MSSADFALDSSATSPLDTPFSTPSRPSSFVLPNTYANAPLVQPKGDIYRNSQAGEPSTRLRRLSTLSTTATSTSSSSSIRWPISGLAALVERAISRWARSSSSDGSNASTETLSTVPRPHHQRPARTSRLFTLLLPPEPEPIVRVVQTENLALVMTKMSGIRRRPTRQRKEGRDGREPRSRDKAEKRKRKEARQDDKGKEVGLEEKGKGRIRDVDLGHPTAGPAEPKPLTSTTKQTARSAWWLNVASPTPQDMRQIGKLLHLHPLTLEDILYQDPREKLELFPRLGYYFIVCRAMPSTISLAHPPSATTREEIGDLGSACVDGVNVYMVVFADGICSFHFEDVEAHVERVRERALRLESSYPISADFIAHGLIDSIVDAFFPVLARIEREVDSLVNLLHGFDSQVETLFAPEGDSNVTLNDQEAEKAQQAEMEMEKDVYAMDDLTKPKEKYLPPGRVLLPQSTRTILQRIPSRVPLVRRFIPGLKHPKPIEPHVLILYRIAWARRLVTSITRLLVHKTNVVTSLRKRFAGAKGVKGEAGMYLGDVQDHILAMQHALTYCGNVLSQSHPGYLSHLQIAYDKAKNGMDIRLLYLTIIAVSILSIQVCIGFFSMNVNIPRNTRVTLPPDPPAPFHWFGAVVALNVAVFIAVLLTVRKWWVDAKRKHKEKRSRR